MDSAGHVLQTLGNPAHLYIKVKVICVHVSFLIRVQHYL